MLTREHSLMELLLLQVYFFKLFILRLLGYGVSAAYGGRCHRISLRNEREQR